MTHDAPTLLVTGGLGYLGSRLLRDVAGAFPGAHVRVLDNLHTHGQRALMELPEGASYEFVEGDVLDPGVTRYALRDVDAVIHLAALVRTPMSFEHPTWTLQVNHWGTSALAEACLKADVRRLVFASSTAVYGPGGPFDETAACRPLGPYAESKRGAERALEGARERGLDVSVLRLGMLYGPAPVLRFDGFVNRLAFLAGTGRPLTVHGDGAQRRPVLHVEDASRALLAQVAADLPTPLANVVEASLSVREVADALTRARPGVRVLMTDQDVLNYLSFEVDAARLRGTGWAPRRRLEEALAELLERFVGFGRGAAG